MSTTLQDLVNRAVFLSTETQTHFGGLIADAAWEVDFTADPHLTFTDEDGAALRTRPHLLGSESTSQGTWLWGWENINEFPEAVVGLSHEVRKFGAAEDLSEFVTPELDLDDELALRLTLAAKEATGKWAHYPAAAGAGTTVWLLVDVPELVLPEPTVKASVRALMQGLTQTTVNDHRAALAAYVAKRGIPTAPLAGGGLRLLFADGSADISFDEMRRISNCEVHAPLEGEAATQYSEITGITVATEEPTPAAASPAETPTPDRAEAPVAADSSPEADGAAAAAGTTGGESSAGTSTPARPEEPRSDRAEVPAAETPERSDVRPSPAEAAAATAGTDRGAEAESEPAARERDTASAEGEAAPADEAARSEEPKEKKKGLFSRLFGR